MSADGTIHIHPIGTIRSGVAAQQTGGFTGLESRIELKPEYLEFLVGLEDYSHIKVIYWLSEMTETHGLHRPQSNAEVPLVGMFACR
jgi:tRNA (adenine37-N6)-methyltransferase